MPAKRTNPFKLRDFKGVNIDVVGRLEQMGITTSGQLLLAGKSPKMRATLARAAGIPEAAVHELVKLSDLARLPGVKAIRARLYYDAGVDTVEKLAACEPEALLARTAEFVTSTRFDGIAPLPKEVSSTISNAKTLPKVVEW